MVALHSAVHDSSVSLLRDALLRDLGINPIWKAPHARIDLAKLNRRGRVVPYRVHECRVEISVIEKHIRIVVPSVEMTFDRFYGFQHAI